MIHPRNSYRFTVAFLSLSSLFWLTACTPERPEWLGGDPKRPAEDVVIGPKRTPLLNPRFGGHPAGNQGSEASGQPSPPGSPPPSFQNNPYDYFDDSGNPKPAAAPPPAAAPSDNNPTMIERWLGSDNQEKPPSLENQYMARKQFPANPSYSGETVGIAPIPPGPQAAIISPAAGEPSVPTAMMEEPAPAASADMKPVQPPVQEIRAAQPLVADAPAPVVVPPPAVAMAEPVPAVAVPQEAAPASQPSWFDRMVSRVSGEPESSETQANKNMPYPELSSVPERPKEFNKLKASKETQMQDLEIEHVIAQEQRQMLGAEPSQLGAVPAPVPAAPAPATPENVTASPPPVAALAPAPAGGPVLLGHAYDDRLSAPSSENIAVPVRETVAAPMPESYPAPSAPEKDTSWWDRLNVFSREKAKPPAAESVSQAPVDAPSAQPADETAKEESAAGDTAGLPPPAMLETVKTLPPSRYSDRARAMQLQTE